MAGEQLAADVSVFAEWITCGCPEATPAVKGAQAVLRRLYAHSCVGGPAHIVTDDQNIEDEHIDSCIKCCDEEPDDCPEAIQAARWVLTAMRAMTWAERCTLMAWHSGEIDENGKCDMDAVHSLIEDGLVEPWDGYVPRVNSILATLEAAAGEFGIEPTIALRADLRAMLAQKLAPADAHTRTLEIFVKHQDMQQILATSVTRH